MNMRVLTVFGAIAIAVGVMAFPGDAKAQNGPKDIYSIVDLAIDVNAESGEFETLIAAVVATGLDAVLDDRGQFTVFAPIDAAFAEIGLDATVIAAMNDDELSSLTDVLLFHVARGQRLSGDVVESDQIRMASKQFTDVTVSEDGVFINEAEILIEEELFDLVVDNGVVHVIDGVLLP